MIKKFNDFDIDGVKNGEREHFERELNARKKMRSEKSGENDLDFKDIKDLITTEIQNEEDYHITSGKRLIEMDGIKDDDIHIEYQSPEAGRIRIFKPKDTSSKGYYEVNGKIFHADGDEIRNFYHYLNQELMDKPIVEKNVYSFEEFIHENIFSDRYEDEDYDDKNVFSRKYIDENGDSKIYKIK